MISYIRWYMEFLREVQAQSYQQYYNILVLKFLNQSFLLITLIMESIELKIRKQMIFFPIAVIAYSFVQLLITFIIQIMLGSQSRMKLNSRSNRFKSYNKNTETKAENSLYLSPQMSTQSSTKRFKLVPLFTNQESYSIHKQNNIQKSNPNFGELSRIEQDISNLQSQLRQKERIKTQLDQSRYIYPKSNLVTLQERDEDQNSYRRNRKTEMYDQNIIWRNPDCFTPSSKRIKIFKIKERKYKQSNEGYLPLIKKSTGTSRNKEYLYQIVNTAHHQKRRGNTYSFRAIKNFRKIAHAVLFTIYLTRFNEKMRRNRLGYFERYIKSDIKQQMVMLKDVLMEASEPFLQKIISHGHFDFVIDEKQDKKLKLSKINSMKELVRLEIQCIQKCIRSICNRNQFTQLFYYLCRHGSYACFYKLNTEQELNITCLSQKYGYMRGDQYLQKSAIISFCFIKILLFNTITEIVRGKADIIIGNTKLAANILYQIFIDIQDDYLQKPAPIYKIDNWRLHKKSIKLADSMTVKEGFIQDNELISGLNRHKYTKEVYKTKFMVEERKVIEELVNCIHTNIVKMHEKLCRKYF